MSMKTGFSVAALLAISNWAQAQEIGRIPSSVYKLAGDSNWVIHGLVDKNQNTIVGHHVREEGSILFVQKKGVSRWQEFVVPGVVNPRMVKIRDGSIVVTGQSRGRPMLLRLPQGLGNDPGVMDAMFGWMKNASPIEPQAFALPDDLKSESAPLFAQDSEGRYWLLTEPSVRTVELRSARSLAGPWTPVALPEAGMLPVEMIADEAGHLFLIGSAYDGVLWLLSRGAAGWEKTAISDAQEYARRSPEQQPMLIGRDGTLHLLYQKLGSDRDFLVHWSRAKDGRQSEEKIHVPASERGSEAVGYNASIVEDAQGRLHASFCDEKRRLALASRSGSSWTLGLINPEPYSAQSTQLFIDARGTLNVLAYGPAAEANLYTVSPR